MAELIITFVGVEPRIQVHPWTYERDMLAPEATTISVLPGVSPVREALVARKAFAEQELDAWTEHPLSALIYPGVEKDDSPGPPLELRNQMAERLVEHAQAALAAEAEATIERHPAAFGAVLVVPTSPDVSLAFAIAGAWPCEILEVDRIDRVRRTADVVQTVGRPTLLVASDITTLYRSIVESMNPDSSGAQHVDTGTA